MKTFLLILILFGSSAYSNTNTQVRPQSPVNCKLKGVDRVNYINNLKSSENSQLLEVSFITYHGRCRNGKFYIAEISPYMQIGLYNLGVRAPWKKYYTPNAEIQLMSHHKAKVTVTVNKTLAFSRSDKRFFKMKIFPNSKNSFMWNIFFRYDEKNDKTSMKLTSK